MNTAWTGGPGSGTTTTNWIGDGPAQSSWGEKYDLDQLFEQLFKGDPQIQRELLDLLKCLFDPNKSFFVGTNSNMPTLTQMQFLQASLPALVGYSRAIVCRRDYGVSPIQSLRNCPVQMQIVVPNLAGSNGTLFPPTLTWTIEHFVPEVATPLTLSPQMSASFSTGRINSYTFAVQSAQNSLANQYTTGSMAVGEVGDNRDVTSLHPTDLAMQSVVSKNGNAHIDAWEGVAMMGSPGFSPLIPVDMHLVYGNGEAAYVQNVLSSAVPFNNNVNQLALASTTGATGAAVQFVASPTNTNLVTDAVLTVAGSQIVYNNAIWMSPYTTLTAGNANITNLQLSPVGQDTLPILQVQVRVPCTMGGRPRVRRDQAQICTPQTAVWSNSLRHRTHSP